MQLRVHLMSTLVISASLLASNALAADYQMDAETYTAAIRHAAGHPNERSRWHGLWAYSQQRYPAARKHFEQAARYADKPSQYLLSVMHFRGEGGPEDPVEAYIWADLAAERGNSEDLLAARERIWLALTAAQQQAVLERGPGFYATYGDAVAVPRTNSYIARFSRGRTGSRAGGDTGTMTITFGTGTPSNKMEASPGNKPEVKMWQGDFYGAQRTDVSLYWQGQDVALHEILRGNVRVGNLKRIP